MAPLQRLLNEHASLGAGDRIEKVRRSMEFAVRLQKAGARYFAANPLATARLADMGRHDPHYLAHEYYNANWAPFYHADVARDLAQAKLAFAGSASLIDNFNQFALKPEMAKIVAEIGERALAETIKDYARNQTFRRDVYTRGAPKAAPPQLEAMLARMRASRLSGRARPAACRADARRRGHLAAGGLRAGTGRARARADDVRGTCPRVRNAQSSTACACARRCSA